MDTELTRRDLLRGAVAATVAAAAAARFGSAAGAASAPTTSRLPLLCAHEFGDYRGLTYTSSLEAFNYSYSRGFRLFECDLALTADGAVLLAHPGNESHYGLPTGSHFIDVNVSQVRHGYDGLTLLRGASLLQLVAQHPDVTVVLDTKEQHSSSENQQIITSLVHWAKTLGLTSVLPRLIPTVAGATDTAAYRAMGMKNVILALYRTQWLGQLPDAAVLDLVAQQRIPHVMMWAGLNDPRLSLVQNNLRHQRYTPQFALELRKLGVQPYVHSLSAPSAIHQMVANHVGVFASIWPG